MPSEYGSNGLSIEKIPDLDLKMENDWLEVRILVETGSSSGVNLHLWLIHNKNV